MNSSLYCQCQCISILNNWIVIFERAEDAVRMHSTEREIDNCGVTWKKWGMRRERVWGKLGKNRRCVMVPHRASSLHYYTFFFHENHVFQNKAALFLVFFPNKQTISIFFSKIEAKLFLTCSQIWENIFWRFKIQFFKSHTK